MCGISGLRLEHLGGVLQGFGGDARAGDHAAEFLDAILAREFVDGGDDAAFLLAFGDQIVVIGEGGDLGEVRDAEDLLSSSEAIQAFADAFGDGAADAGVDFIEDERGRHGLPFDVADAGLQGEGDAGEFAAGSDLLEGLGSFAEVG